MSPEHIEADYSPAPEPPLTGTLTAEDIREIEEMYANAPKMS